MAERDESLECCEADRLSKGMKSCSVEALITIDERGQIVLPKDLREKARVKAGDKFVVMSCESDGKVYCIFLVKAGDFAETAKGMLGSVMKGIL